MSGNSNILFIDGELFIRFSALVDLGVSDDTIKWGLRHSDKNWQAIPDPEDGRARLIKYEPLRSEYKELIKAKYGCPYSYAKVALIAACIPLLSDEDRKVIDGYVLPSKVKLSEAERERFKGAARVLSFLAELPRLSKSIAQGWGFDSGEDFWLSVRNYIKTNEIALPTSRRLEEKVREYQKHGAIVVIHERRYGNTNGTKIGDIHKALLVELMSDPRKFSISEVSRQFMAIAEDKGWDKAANVTYQAVFNHVKKLRNDWELSRHGERFFKANRELTINQRKVSEPNIQWQIDGTPAALVFFNEVTKQLEKLYLVSVMDSASECIIGYAFGYTETTGLVAEALKMAIQLQGAVPHELRSDKGSAITSGETQDLLESLGIVHIPTSTGNAKGKSIEIAQRWWMQLDSVYFDNRLGMNVTAHSQDSKVNPEALREKLSNFPTNAEALMGQIMESIALYNNRKRKDGTSPAEKQKEPQTDRRAFDAQSLVEHFGIFRRKGKKLQTYRFDNEGLEMIVGKHKFRYLPAVDTADEVAEFLSEHMNVTQFYVKYDPTDLSQIALYILKNGEAESKENLLFHSYATYKHLASQTRRGETKQEKEALQKGLAVKKEQIDGIKQKAEQRKAMLKAHNILEGAINIQDVHKDTYNKAKLEVQRLMALGYGELITEDLRVEQAAESTKEEKRITSLNIYLDRYED